MLQVFLEEYTMDVKKLILSLTLAICSAIYFIQTNEKLDRSTDMGMTTITEKSQENKRSP